MTLSDPLTVFIQLAVAVLLGMLIGTERVAAGKRAGTRTFALVSLGAALFVITGREVAESYLGVLNFDPLRVTAAIIQGIGFLGAGLIFIRDNSLNGLTTAAGLWVAAGVGIAAGFGLFALATFATCMTLFVFTVVWRIEDFLKRMFDTHEIARSGPHSHFRDGEQSQ